jgi:hypothetical protein
MSEFTATINAYFDDQNKRNELIKLLEEQPVIHLGDDEFDIQHIDVGALVSFTLFTGGFGLDKPVLQWLSSISAKYITVEFFGDELNKSVALMDSKRKSFNVVLTGLAEVSTTFAAGLAFRAGPKKTLDFLKNNEVDLFEEFQGKRHIDHLFRKCNYQYPKIFEYLVDHEMITDDLLVTGGWKNKVPNIRAIHSLKVATAVKLYRNGKHPEIFHEKENNLLSEFHYRNDSLEDLIYLYQRSAEQAYDEHKHGREPITNLFDNLQYQEKLTRSKELDFVEKLKVILGFKDNLKFVDGFASRCLTRAKGFKHMEAFLKATLPSLIAGK